MREGLSFEKESPSCALPKKAGAGLIYRLQIKLCASEAIPKRPIGLFFFCNKKIPILPGDIADRENIPHFPLLHRRTKRLEKIPYIQRSFLEKRNGRNHSLTTKNDFPRIHFLISSVRFRTYRNYPCCWYRSPGYCGKPQESLRSCRPDPGWSSACRFPHPAW